MSDNLSQALLEKEICSFIQSELVAKEIVVEPGSFLSEIGLDSFSKIEIVLFLERKFGIELPDEILTPENIESPSSLSKCAIEYVAQQG